MFKKPVRFRNCVVLAAVGFWGFTGCGQAPTASPPAVLPQAGSTDHLVVPERAGIFLEATTHYGPLVVKEGDDYAEADLRPWSSYWYPIKDDILVNASERNGGQATLDKYDHYSSKASNIHSTSLDFEKSSGLFDPYAALWEGRCNAWAIASVMEPEPVLPVGGVDVQGVKFFTRDVKALVLKSYEVIDPTALKRFGQRYNGEPGDDFDDIYPDQFHRVMQAELFGRHRPFIMDDDPGIEIWNTAIWKAETTLTKDASDKHVMHVFTRVLSARSVGVDPDFSGRSQNTTFEYTYDLVGLPQGDGSLLVKYGKWTGSSVRSHPDFVQTLPDKGVKIKHSTKNTELNQSVIDDILLKTGAFNHS